MAVVRTLMNVIINSRKWIRERLIEAAEEPTLAERKLQRLKKGKPLLQKNHTANT
jgi:hypothetical protein